MPAPAPLVRPPYWSQEFVLAELRAGRTMASIIAEAVELSPPPRGPAPATYRQDIFRWKRENPAFADEYDELMGDRIKEGAGANEKFGPGEQVEFLAEMAANGGDLHRAAYDIGFSPGTILTRINPKSVSFDPDFAERFYQAEAERHGEVYKAMYEEALGCEANGNKRNAWLIQKLAESRLPHLFNAKKTLEVEGTVTHQHMILPAAVTRQLAVQQKALEERRAPAIDVEARLLPSEAEG